MDHLMTSSHQKHHTVFVLQGPFFDYSARESPRQREAASQVHQDNEGWLVYTYMSCHVGFWLFNAVTFIQISNYST